MFLIKNLRYLALLILILSLGTETSYAKTELVLSNDQVSFSIEKDKNFESLEKEVQPSIGFLKEKQKKSLSIENKNGNKTTRLAIDLKDVASGVVKNVDEIKHL